MPKKKLTKFRVTGNAVVQPGTQLRASHFQPGQYVDILGRRQVSNESLSMQVGPGTETKPF